MRTFPIVSVFAVALSLSCHQLKTIEKKSGDPEAGVRGTVPFSLSLVVQALEQTRDRLERYTPPGFVPEAEYLRPKFFITKHGSREFSEFDVRRLAESDNPWLLQYMAIPPEARRHDLRLQWVTDVFWPAEAYVYDGRPARFTTNFIVHFEAVDESTTALEIFELLPTIWVGRKYGVGAHGPGSFRDYRDAEQSLGERVDLLDFVRKLIHESEASRNSGP